MVRVNVSRRAKGPGGSSCAVPRGNMGETASAPQSSPAAFALPGWGGQESTWAHHSQHPNSHCCLPMQSPMAGVFHAFLCMALGEPSGSRSSLSTLPASLPGEAHKDRPSCGIFPPLFLFISTLQGLLDVKCVSYTSRLKLVFPGTSWEEREEKGRAHVP